MAAIPSAGSVTPENTKIVRSTHARCALRVPREHMHYKTELAVVRAQAGRLPRCFRTNPTTAILTQYSLNRDATPESMLLTLSYL
eukprot:COSAG02_NODE_18374_length_943_cov_0.612559_1_plen_84_part_10